MLPPMTINGYDILAGVLQELYMLSTQQSMKNAAFEVKGKLSTNKENLVDQAINCDVSFDVSWQIKMVYIKEWYCLSNVERQ